MNIYQHKTRRNTWTGAQIVFVLVLLVICASASGAQTNTFPSTGNVGIGTTSPAATLSIVSSSVNGLGVGYQGSGSNRLLFGAEFNGTTAAESNVGFIGYGPTSAGGSARSIALGSYTGGEWKETMRLQSGGNVGIGTTSPSQKFHLYTSSGNVYQQIESGGTGAAGQIFKRSGASDWLVGQGAASANANFEIYSAGSADATWNMNGSTRLMIQGSSGNVGIGTNDPSTALSSLGGSWGNSGLTIGNGSASVGLVLHSSATSPNSSLRFATGASGIYDQGFLLYNHSANSMSFGTNRGTRMTIDSSGNVGIGTTTPANKLHVAGSITVDGNINAKYQDVAEWVESSEKLATGTVVVLDATKSNQVISSTQPYDMRVAGVISGQPGIALGESGAGKVLVATTGRVRVKADATQSPIGIGDLLVTSDIPGVAMKSEAVNLGGIQIHRPGTLIGKALEPLSKGRGEILVLLSLQ